MGDVDDPAGREHRSRRPRASTPRLRVVGSLARPDADALDRGPGRGLHHRTTVAAPRPGRRDAQRRRPGRRPGLGPRLLSPAARRSPRPAVAPGRRHAPPLERRPDVLAYSPSGRGAAVHGHHRRSARTAADRSRADEPRCHRRGGPSSGRSATCPSGRVGGSLTRLRGYEGAACLVADGRLSRAPCYHASASRRPAGETPRAARFPEAQDRGETADAGGAPHRQARPACRCPRRSSPRTTSSSCTTPARAARASG